MPCSRAYRIAPIFPSMPRTPNPPGIRIPSTPSSSAAAPSGSSQASLITQRMFTWASLAKPPALSASAGDKYASGRSTYLPTSAIVMLWAGRCTRRSRSSHSFQSTSWNGSISRRTT